MTNLSTDEQDAILRDFLTNNDPTERTVIIDTLYDELSPSHQIQIQRAIEHFHDHGRMPVVTNGNLPDREPLKEVTTGYHSDEIAKVITPPFDGVATGYQSTNDEMAENSQFEDTNEWEPVVTSLSVSLPSLLRLQRSCLAKEVTTGSRCNQTGIAPPGEAGMAEENSLRDFVFDEEASKPIPFGAGTSADRGSDDQIEDSGLTTGEEIVAVEGPRDSLPGPVGTSGYLLKSPPPRLRLTELPAPEDLQWAMIQLFHNPPGTKGKSEWVIELQVCMTPFETMASDTQRTKKFFINFTSPREYRKRIVVLRDKGFGGAVEADMVDAVAEYHKRASRAVPKGGLIGGIVTAYEAQTGTDWLQFAVLTGYDTDDEDLTLTISFSGSETLTFTNWTFPPALTQKGHERKQTASVAITYHDPGGRGGAARRQFQTLTATNKAKRKERALQEQSQPTIDPAMLNSIIRDYVKEARLDDRQFIEGLERRIEAQDRVIAELREMVMGQASPDAQKP